ERPAGERQPVDEPRPRAASDGEAALQGDAAELTGRPRDLEGGAVGRRDRPPDDRPAGEDPRAGGGVERQRRAGVGQRPDEVDRPAGPGERGRGGDRERPAEAEGAGGDADRPGVRPGGGGDRQGGGTGQLAL